MRNRNHTLPLVAVGLFIVCSSPAGANEPAAAGAAKDHDCSLPANIRNKVEHCHQVGDFGGPEREDYRPGSFGRSKGRSQWGGAQTNPKLDYKAAPWLRDVEKSQQNSKKQTQPEQDPKKNQIIEIKSDSEPQKNTK